MEAINTEVEKYNKAVWDVIINEIPKRFSDPNFVNILSYIPKARRHFGANRPFAVFLGFLYGQGRSSDDRVIVLSAAMEVLNCSITYIDDKIFDDDLYVGETLALHKKSGLPLAILASSIFRNLARDMVINVTPEPLLKKIIQEIGKISEEADYGQFLDVTYSKRFQGTIGDALTINDLRTGQFVRRCAEIGYFFSGKDEKERRYLYDSFKLYGRAVQDANDFDDVNFTEHSSGSHGMDIRLFKKTKPIIKALELANDKQKEILFQVLGNSYASDPQVQIACKIVSECGALEWTVNDICSTLEKAKKLIRSSNNETASKISDYFDLTITKLKKKYEENDQ